MNGSAKKKRSLDTLILPEGVKEELLRDMREFLAKEEWYTWAGVPHRRGKKDLCAVIYLSHSYGPFCDRLSTLW